MFTRNYKESFVSMASVTPASSSTKETTNYARLCRVIVDVGTCALRDCFDTICSPPTLHTVLTASQATLQSLRSRRIINATQWGKLFPAVPASVSSRDFDITLLMILLIKNHMWSGSTTDRMGSPACGHRRQP